MERRRKKTEIPAGHLKLGKLITVRATGHDEGFTDLRHEDVPKRLAALVDTVTCRRVTILMHRSGNPRSAQ